MPQHGSNRRQADATCKTGRTLLVYGLGRVNCDEVFNMFCLYGNVSAVKVLKDGPVLVELDDDESARRCVFHLHSLPLCDTTEMSVKYFKHSFIYDDRKLNKLSDCPSHIDV